MSWSFLRRRSSPECEIKEGVENTLPNHGNALSRLRKEEYALIFMLFWTPVCFIFYLAEGGGAWGISASILLWSCGAAACFISTRDSGAKGRAGKPCEHCEGAELSE